MSAPVMTSAADAVLSEVSPYLADVGLVPNAWGGFDLAEGVTTIRVVDIDGTLGVNVFTNGRAMLLEASSTFVNMPAAVVALAVRAYLVGGGL